jgi:hypothetical protein
MINLILVMPNPLTKTLLFTSFLLGVNALGTSTNETITALTSWQRVSAQPTGFIAIKHALYVPVALYWCFICNLDVVIKLSPSPKNHLKFVASGDERLLKDVGVFSTGGSGEKVKLAAGIGNTVIVKVVVSARLHVFGSLAINVIVYVPGVL